MRVAIVSRELAPFFGAGIGAYASAMARAWAAAGHDIHVLTEAHPGLAEGAAAALSGVRIHALDTGSGTAAKARYAFQKHAFAAWERLTALHAEAPFDLIEFPDYWAEGAYAIAAHRTLGALKGAVLAVKLHTPTRECRDLNRESWLDEEIATLEAMEEQAIRDADLVLSPTASLLDIVTRRLGLAGGPACGVIPYPFDFGGLETLGASEPAAPVPAIPTVLFIGRLERRKGVELLVLAAQRALERGGRFAVRFIGGDTQTGPGQTSMLAHLRSLVQARFAAAFSFEGPVARRAVGPAVRAAAASGGCCCFPSRWENFPNVCLEAMALGCPVIGSSRGGMAEMPGNGPQPLVVDPDDPEKLTEAIERVLGDAGLRQRMTADGPSRVRQLCDPGLIVSRHVDVVGKARGTTRSERAVAWTPIAIAPGCRAALAAAGDRWVVLHEAGAGIAAIPSQVAPDLGCAVFLAARSGQLHTPVGLSREMLSVVDCGAFGAIAARGSTLVAAAFAIGEPALVASGGLWRLAAHLAHAGERSTLVPAIVENAGPCDARESARTSEALAQELPGLAADAGRALRLRRGVDSYEIASARAEMRAHKAEADRLRSALSAAEGRAGAAATDLASARAALDALLASPRYKLADRASAAADAMGLRPAIKAVKRLAKDDPKP